MFFRIKAPFLGDRTDTQLRLGQLGFTAVITATLTWFVTYGLNNYRSTKEHRLSYTCSAFETDVDTRYVPILGLTFAKKKMRIYTLAVLNQGSAPQERVRILLKNLGEVISVTPMNYRPLAVRALNGAALDTFTSFVGQSQVSLELPVLPPADSWIVVVFTHPSEDNALPLLGVNSDAMRANWIPPNPTFVKELEDEYSGIPSLASMKAAPIRRLDWK